MAKYESMSDEDLIEAFYACDEEAFIALDRRWRKSLRSFLYTLCRNWEQAEDLVQVTLVKVYLTKDKSAYSRDKGSFKAFIFEIARHSFCDWWKIHRRNREVPLRENETGEYVTMEPSNIRCALLDCIARLPEQERMFILLWKGPDGPRSQTEIATMLGVSPARVTTIKRNALCHLREYMSE